MGARLRLLCVLIHAWLGGIENEGYCFIFHRWSWSRCSLRTHPCKESGPADRRVTRPLGMVIGEQFGTWIQTKKLDVSHAASVCLVGERYDVSFTVLHQARRVMNQVPSLRNTSP